MNSGITVLVVLIVLLAGCGGYSTAQADVNSTTTAYSENTTTVQTPIYEQPVEHTPRNPTNKIAVNAEYELDVTEVEELTFRGVNDIRRKNNRELLHPDPELDRIARHHSYSMYMGDFYDHVDPILGGPTRRMVQSGYNCPNKYGENIHAVPYNVTLERWNQTFDLSTEDGLAHFIVESWNHSRPHRLGMLDEEYEVGGIGIFATHDERLFVTMEFCG